MYMCYYKWRKKKNFILACETELALGTGMPKSRVQITFMALLVRFLCFASSSETFSSILPILRWQIFNFTGISAIQKLPSLRVCTTIWSSSTMSSIHNLRRKPYVYWLTACNVKILTYIYIYIYIYSERESIYICIYRKRKRMRWAGQVARMGEDRGAHKVLVRKPEGKRPLGRPRRRWEDNIKMDFQEVGGVRVAWMELAQDRDRWRALVSTVRNFRVS